MLALCMDTSHIFLAVSLIEDNKVLCSIQKECWKRQSEEIFPALEELLKKVNKKVEDIDSIVITKGPGSYTGVRIAMTIAKVFAATRKINLYTIGTLQLYAGNESNVLVLLDARGKRAYSAIYDEGKELETLAIRNLDEVTKLHDTYQNIIGDGHLIGESDYYPDIASNFCLLKDKWEKCENIHLVTPEYLKANEAYFVK